MKTTFWTSICILEQNPSTATNGIIECSAANVTTIIASGSDSDSSTAVTSRRRNSEENLLDSTIIKEMATARPKSPRPVVTKPDKEESIWDKLGTLGRKKRIKEGEYFLMFLMSIYGYIYFTKWACLYVSVVF